MVEAVDPTGKGVFCSELARETRDPLAGTATDVGVWLLLEYREPWHAKAEYDNDLPEPVQNYLQEQLAAIPASRLLFIKQQKPTAEERQFFIVRTDEETPAIDEFTLAAYEEILDLNLAAVAAGDETYADHRRDDPLFLVCTNTKRDKCCARFGVPLYQALLQKRPDLAWQSTHIGGHRYAPNVLFLPHSVNYGYLAPEQIGPAVDAYLDGQLYDLDHYRGRTYYTPEVQAADAFLRRELKLNDLTGLRLQAAEQEAEDTWRVEFVVASAGERHVLYLQASEVEPSRLVSCSPPSSKPVYRYGLIAHELL